MSFTDDDLKRLKMQLNADLGVVDFKWTWPEGTLEALLARLEAAERVCSEVGEMQEWRWSLKKALEAWRKSSGKDR